MYKSMKGIIVLLIAAAGTGLAATLMLWWVPAMAAEPSAAPALPAGAVQWGFLAAALATGLSSLGAGIAVASVGSAAIVSDHLFDQRQARSNIIVDDGAGHVVSGLERDLVPVGDDDLVCRPSLDTAPVAC